MKRRRKSYPLYYCRFQCKKTVEIFQVYCRQNVMCYARFYRRYTYKCHNKPVLVAPHNRMMSIEYKTEHLYFFPVCFLARRSTTDSRVASNDAYKWATIAVSVIACIAIVLLIMYIIWRIKISNGLYFEFIDI